MLANVGFVEVLKGFNSLCILFGGKVGAAQVAPKADGVKWIQQIAFRIQSILCRCP